MPLNDDGKGVCLDALAAVAVWVSAHDGDPSTTGANELSGGVYGREAITWNSAASGAIDSSNTPVIQCNAADGVYHLGLWSAETVGTFYGSADVTDEDFGADGTYTVTDFDISIT
jgi:hypothetical protein